MKAAKEWGAAALVVLASALPVAQAAKPDFAQLMTTKPALDRQGIRVWTYREPGNPAFSYMASTVMDAPVASVVASLQDIEYLNQWVPQVDRIEELQPSKDGKGLLRMVVNFPFPVQDRDVIIRSSSHQQADGTVVVRNVTDNTVNYPVQPNMVRVPGYEGDWVIKPLDGGKRAQVLASGFANPGGMIPLAVVNLFVEQQPYMMLRKMREVVKQPRYAKAKLNLPRR